MIPYAIAQGATEIPWAFAQTLLFSCIAYFMIHFDFTAGALPLVLSNQQSELAKDFDDFAGRRKWPTGA